MCIRDRLNTMPGWAGSSWYWMRYMDAHNDNEFASEEALKYWQNVDLYIGGSEHATGHLLYSRFWNKFLKDKGFAPTEEPFKKLINQGMILGTSAFVYRLINFGALGAHVEGDEVGFKNQIFISYTYIKEIVKEVNLLKIKNDTNLKFYRKGVYLENNKVDNEILSDLSNKLFEKLNSCLLYTSRCV